MAESMEQRPGEVKTEQIPRERWEQFLYEFTEFNAEVPVRIEVVRAAETGNGILADHQPLLDVTLDDAAGVPLLLIECGDPAALAAADRGPATFRHMIREPRTLWARRTDPAGWDALQIESAEGAFILSLLPHPDSEDSEDARKELLEAGVRARAAS